jgi:RNA recognition motif-containing protein
MDLGNKLYVGNLSFDTTEADLRTLFEQHGAIESVKVITDRDTGRPRGFAFVEMKDGSGAQKAKQALNGRDVGGRNIRVDEAQDRPSGGGGGGAGRGRY